MIIIEILLWLFIVLVVASFLITGFFLFVGSILRVFLKSPQDFEDTGE